MTTIWFDKLQGEMKSLAELSINRSLRAGAQEAESIVSWADVISLNIATSKIEGRRGLPSGIGIRVVVDGKVGFAASSGLSSQQIENLTREAISVARIRPPDPYFKHLPDPMKLSSRDAAIDKRVVEYSEQEAFESASELVQSTFDYDKRINSVHGNIKVHRGCVAISNSRGIDDFTETAYVSASIGCTANEQGKRKAGEDFYISREMRDYTGIGKKAAQRSVRMLSCKPLGQTLKTSIVWENMSIGALLEDMIDSACDAENVQEGKSHFAKNLEQKVANENITMTDDGQLADGINTSKIDGEGTPSQKTTIIEKGILTSFLHNSYSALRDNKESTGNANRDWPEPFLQLPQISTTNLVLKAGTKKLDELVEEVDQGILVTGEVMGVGMANTYTGEFSVVAPNALLIKAGEVTDALEPVTIAGNFFESLKKVDEIGSDSRLLGGSKMPSVIINDLTVSG